MIRMLPLAMNIKVMYKHHSSPAFSFLQAEVTIGYPFHFVLPGMEERIAAH
uniref:Uncharacterized protein n=1 Tax=Arundo donax TaxID=35708 RepID=A0A0A9B7Y8_ARUDO